MEKEIWKEVPNYENYMISSMGRVKSLNFNKTGKERLLKQGKSRQHLKVTLWNEQGNTQLKVHQLVAIAFLGHVRSGSTRGLVVDHIDNDPLNNNLSNLQVITNRENTSKDTKNKTSAYTGVSWHKASKRWRAQIRLVGRKVKSLGTFTNELEASEAYQKKLKEIQK